jgi:glycosyltransferase involved in cell wall biosynthesis
VGLESDSKSGMSATLGDVLNRGRVDAFVTNISERGYLFHGNNLRLNFLPELGRFQQAAEGVVADAGWAWGAQLGDLDNDGRNELFVVNGYVSRDRTKSYWYAMSKIAGANGNVFEDARSWPAIGTASLSGYERSRVLVNRGLAGWTDVAAAVGVTDEYDGRAVALADLFNRGVLDVVVANQGQPALVYKNSVAPGNHWIAFKLVGTRSNRSAIGAEVVLVTGGGTRQLKVVDGGSGFASQNDRRLHFGLGRTTQVDSAVIHWPSGGVQTLAHPAVDRAQLASGTATGGALLCVAAVTHDKGHDVLVDALTAISDLSWSCVCVGRLDRDPAFVDAVRRRSADAGLGDRVQFPGPRSGAELDRSYAAADVMVLASRAETYGMVVIEALARGVPVIAADVGGLTEALGHGADGIAPGLLVSPDDVGALAAALRSWLGDAQLRGRLRRAALERRESLPTWSGTASDLAAILTETSG